MRIELEPCRETLSRNLRDWMADSRMLLKDVSGRLNVGTSTVSQWANGRRFPRPEDIDRIARMMKTTPGCLLCASGPLHEYDRAGRRTRKD